MNPAFSSLVILKLLLSRTKPCFSAEQRLPCSNLFFSPTCLFIVTAMQIYVEIASKLVILLNIISSYSFLLWHLFHTMTNLLMIDKARSSGRVLRGTYRYSMAVVQAISILHFKIIYRTEMPLAPKQNSEFPTPGESTQCVRYS